MKKKKTHNNMNTVGDLLRVLNYYKDNYPEFEKYILTIDAADDDSLTHDFRGVELYVNTDIGQVEISYTEKDNETNM